MTNSIRLIVTYVVAPLYLITYFFARIGGNVGVAESIGPLLGILWFVLLVSVPFLFMQNKRSGNIVAITMFVTLLFDLFLFN